MANSTRHCPPEHTGHHHRGKPASAPTGVKAPATPLLNVRLIAGLAVRKWNHVTSPIAATKGHDPHARILEGRLEDVGPRHGGHDVNPETSRSMPRPARRTTRVAA